MQNVPILFKILLQQQQLEFNEQVHYDVRRMFEQITRVTVLGTICK